MTVLKIVCSWCGKPCGEKDGQGQEGTTSTICPDCRKKFDAGLSQKRVAAGRKGGAQTMKRLGREFFSAIGKRGGRPRSLKISEIRLNAAFAAGATGRNEQPTMPELRKRWKRQRSLAAL